VEQLDLGNLVFGKYKSLAEWAPYSVHMSCSWPSTGGPPVTAIVHANNGCFQCLFWLVEARSLFTPLHAPSIKCQVSLYADDIVAFVVLTAGDYILLKGILQSFAGVSGLHTNVAKCQATMTKCMEEEIKLVQ
jgi:hypothetical protein